MPDLIRDLMAERYPACRFDMNWKLHELELLNLSKEASAPYDRVQQRRANRVPEGRIANALGRLSSLPRRRIRPVSTNVHFQQFLQFGNVSIPLSHNRIPKAFQLMTRGSISLHPAPIISMTWRVSIK
jgi:hypothetical protein